MSKTTYRMMLPLLAASWFLTCGGGSCKDSSDDGPDYVPGEVAVWFVPGTTESQVEGLASDLGVGVRDIRDYPWPPSGVDRATFVVPEGEESEWVPVIEESPIVDHADLNHTGSVGPPPPGGSASM